MSGAVLDTATASGWRTAGLTAGALVGFAANSILCRLALGARTIDPASFTAIRLVSGAVTLLALARLAGRRRPARRGDWGSAVALFLYAACFSFAYVSLGVGTGALILFGAVQLTMLLAALAGGERPPALEWAGIAAAAGGLVYLAAPGLSAPSPLGSALMAASGVSWGIYSLRGRGGADPLAATAGNFARSVPLVAAVSLATIPSADLSSRGALLAALSGCAASGLGYVLWYAALRGLTATRAAAVQLAVPVLAAAGGVAFLSESVSARLVLSAAAILGGVGLAVTARPRAGAAGAGAALGTARVSE